MEVKKNTIDSYEVITDDDGRIIKLILKCGNLTEEYPIRYDKNGNVMRIGAEWMSFGGDLYIDEIIMSYSGKEFNQSVKQLVNSTYTYNTEDTKLTTFNFTRKDNVNSTVIEKTDDGGIISIYLTGDILNIYTNARKIILPEDSSYMFYNFKSANYLDLSNFSSKNTTNMSHMFDSFASNADKITFTLGNNFDTSKVTDASYMFNLFANGVENDIEIDLGGNLSADCMKNADYMFYGFLRYMVDDGASYCEDTVSFKAMDQYGGVSLGGTGWNYDSSTTYFDFTQYISKCTCDRDCKNTVDDDFWRCHPESWIGTVKGASASIKSVDGVDRVLMNIFYENESYYETVEFIRNKYTNYHVHMDYPVAETGYEGVKTLSGTSLWSHQVHVTYDTKIMSNILCFLSKRAMYDFINTGKIYDFRNINRKYEPILKEFNDKGECVFQMQLYFNENGGLSSTPPIYKKVDVDKITIDLGNFNISNITTKKKIFETATFFYTTQENYNYMTSWYDEKRLSIMIVK